MTISSTLMHRCSKQLKMNSHIIMSSMWILRGCPQWIEFQRFSEWISENTLIPPQFGSFFQTRSRSLYPHCMPQLCLLLRFTGVTVLATDWKPEKNRWLNLCRSWIQTCQGLVHDVSTTLIFPVEKNHTCGSPFKNDVAHWKLTPCAN